MQESPIRHSPAGEGAGMAHCSHGGTSTAAGETLRGQEHLQLGWDRTVAPGAKLSALPPQGSTSAKKPKSKARLLIVIDISHSNNLG